VSAVIIYHRRKFAATFLTAAGSTPEFLTTGRVSSSTSSFEMRANAVVRDEDFPVIFATVVTDSSIITSSPLVAEVIDGGSSSTVLDATAVLSPHDGADCVIQAEIVRTPSWLQPPDDRGANV
jgi:hypothetical protein